MQLGFGMFRQDWEYMAIWTGKVRTNAIFILVTADDIKAYKLPDSMKGILTTSKNTPKVFLPSYNFHYLPGMNS